MKPTDKQTGNNRPNANPVAPTSDAPAPAGFTLEQFYYPDAPRIAEAARGLMRA